MAGENCVIADEMSKYGAFIKNADGIIMILDPDQFSIVNTSRDKVVSPKAVVEAMFNSFLGSRGSGPSGIPLALALSKSDKLEGHELISPSSNIFKNIQYDERRPGFDVQQYNNLMGEVRMFLKGTSEGKSTMIAMNHCFSNTGLFAFSALNCDVKEDEKDIDGGPSPTCSSTVWHYAARAMNCRDWRNLPKLLFSKAMDAVGFWCGMPTAK